MNKSVRWVLMAVALLGLGACASSGGGNSSDTEYNRDIGRVGYDVFQTGLNKVVLGKHGFRMRRVEELQTTLYYETDWALRTPTAEEEAAGIVQAQSRIILRGRKSGPFYRMSFMGENRVRTTLNPNWHTPALSPAFEEYMDRVSTDLYMEVRTGVRGED